MKPGLWAEIHRLREYEKLSIRQIAERLHCSRKTVRKALDRADAPPDRTQKSPSSILDPYKKAIDEILDREPSMSAPRIVEEISKGEEGYKGGISLVRKYLRQKRPSRGRIYQEVEYPPADAMQVDWGHCGSVKVGESVRRVSVFVAVLCYSRLIYIEFALSETKETFYRAIAAALTFFGSVPHRIIVDNLKAAVISGSGRSAVFHPEFEALCAHFRRIKPVACERADPESKGIVEGAVRYVKRNALSGRSEELQSFDDYRRLAVYWRDEVANVRLHRITHERPIDRFEKERAMMRSLPDVPYDSDVVVPALVTSHARVHFDANQYSVPPEYARRQVVLRAGADWIRVCHGAQEVARHRRSYERHALIVDPEHRKAARARRRRTQAREIEERFDDLGAAAKAFRLGLLRRPVKQIVHLRRILELTRLYGTSEVLAALELANEYETFDAAYVQNIIDQERRRRHAPSPLPLSPKRRELLEEVDLEEPDPGEYDDPAAYDDQAEE